MDSANDGRIIRSSSLSRLQDEDEDSNNKSHDGEDYQNQSSPNGAVPHPGHRYYTPQPAKRKALKPNPSVKTNITSKPQISQKPQTPPVQEHGSRQPKLTLTIPKRTGTFGGPSPDSGEQTGSLDTSFDSGNGSASAGILTKRALKPPSAQVRASIAKTNSTSSTPSTAGSVFTPEGLRVTPEYDDGEPIQPKRKAPTRPPVGRRKSDPSCNSRIRRAAAANKESINDFDDENMKPRVSRNRTLEGGISPSEMEKYSGSRHRYFTPQPSRRKFSFRDGQGRVASGNSSPASTLQHPPQYSRSPVERLANQMRSNKQLDRPPSSEAMSPETTPVNSPLKKPRTPTKAAPPPPTTQAAKPEPYDFVTDEEVNVAQKHVGGARRARSMSGGSMQSIKRRPLPSVPHRPRSGSASRADKDIPTVSNKAIQRKRRNRQSAPAGRVASILIDSNTSLHNAAAHSVPGEKRRETLREELLRSLVDGSPKSATLPVKMDGTNIDGDKINGMKQVENSLKVNMVRQKSGYDEPDTAPRFSPLPEKKKSFSNGGNTPSPPSTPTGSPSRQHPRRRRNKSSLSSLVSVPKSLVASNEFLNDILLSDRGSHKKLKAVVGFLVGLILGGLLFLGLYYGLDYPIYPALIIAVLGTAFMALCLAFTVRARCVAALMVPTICTSRGRAAFLTFIVTLLLRGPIHNIYLNSNEVSDSMSCSAQLAYNQSREVQEAAQRVLDAYVRGLLDSVDRIQSSVAQVQKVFEPVEDGLNVLNQGLDAVGNELGKAARACDDILGSAYRSCNRNLNNVYVDCQTFLRNKGVANKVGAVCEIFNADAVCRLLKINSICDTPAYLDGVVNNALGNTRNAMQSVVDTFSADVDFSRYFEKRSNSSTTAEHIQDAISQELDEAYSYVDWILSFSDKLLALSLVWLLFKSYMYHSSYRTKDSFDNQYVTGQFKKLDANRKENGQPHLLPLKKNERNRLIDVTAVRLCKSEKGYFKFGLTTVCLHSIIAGLLMFIDFGLYWLLTKIQEHGDVQIATSGETSTDIEIGGNGVVAELVRILFNEGFKASSSFNTSLDTTVCLPQPVKPDRNLAIIISALYVVTILMTLSQAYAQRLLRYIAAYYYPEREAERIVYLYGRTLQKRQSLMKMLCQSVRRNKKEKDAYNKISISSYLTRRYPCCKGLFTMCGFKQTRCLGCSGPDDGLMVYCINQDCDGVYCEECARALQGKCSLCDCTINLGKVPLEEQQKI
ncbi:uncharacterized protein LOC121409282 isoform X3 [Lytechinus variegatus]|uniref:uncharacterized protein LOC121409282 isoform X3 n=1 Tax=Lytechinus variegatus TaxID=7654 RepID=UPI001BB207B9|nr:uncharacterized protein LOC121409282 isoform X3 [Lytechinus variegatus]